MSHSVSGEPLPPAVRRTGPVTTAAYSVVEWELLTRLPGRVIVAAAAAAPDRPRRQVLAGLDGIAAGRSFDSDLIRAVVAAIYAEPDHGTPATGQASNATRGLVEVLAACRSAVALLAARADPADSAAYRQWVQSVAARVCRTPRTGEPHRLADQRDVPDRRFLDHLGKALGLG